MAIIVRNTMAPKSCFDPNSFLMKTRVNIFKDDSSTNNGTSNVLILPHICLSHILKNMEDIKLYNTCFGPICCLIIIKFYNRTSYVLQLTTHPTCI